MAKHELIAQVIEDLDAINFYDHVMFHCGICDSRVLDNMLTQDTLMKQLEHLDLDAYVAYLCGEEETLDKYYHKPKEEAL